MALTAQQLEEYNLALRSNPGLTKEEFSMDMGYFLGADSPASAYNVTGVASTGDGGDGDININTDGLSGLGGEKSAKIGAIGKIVKGVAGIIGGTIGGGRRRREQQTAQRQFDTSEARFANLDTTNPYEGLTNAYEDLRVNQLQAQFLAQQQQLGLSTTMSALAGAAGGSGIASLAQAMSNQQSRNLQMAAASIGQQEARNQQLAAAGQQRVDMMRAQGDYLSRQMEASKTSTMYGMAHSRLAAANLARQQATAAVIGGAGSAAAGIAGLVVGSDRRLKKNIKLIGYSLNGLKIYMFEYINKIFGKGIFQGVMSDEIPEYAVIKHKDGFDRVDYSKLDVEFKRI
tara:strand:- start:428 stop:1459 length:1032 start_codon:yes stop_codon:yes gene_type:complete